jgi:hypothetical protein
MATLGDEMNARQLGVFTRMGISPASRVFAAAIAAAAWVGLVVQFQVTYSKAASVPLTLWILLAFFTIITNLLVAVIFTLIAFRPSLQRFDSIVAGTMLSIALVGIVNAIFLWGALELSGGSALVDKLLHIATPILVPLFWIFCVRKGGLKWRHPLLWAAYPLLYLAYGMIRGSLTGKYAYPFLDATRLGWQHTALTAFIIAIVFMACGYAVVWIDHLAARKRSCPPLVPSSITVVL